MIQKPIGRPEIELLLSMARYQAMNNIPATTSELARKLQKVPGAIANSKRRLEEHGHIETKSGVVLRKGFDYLQSISLVVPNSIPMLGTVYAGLNTTDINLEDTVENINTSRALKSDTTASSYWLNSPEEPVIIPDLPTDLPVYSMVVEGDSMLEEHIKSGDNVILQPFPINQGPRTGDLIVSMFLAPKNEGLYWDAVKNGEDIDIYALSGPTLKYYYPEQEYYRLSIRKGHYGHEYTIKTRHVKPIGRVFGVYRPIGV